MGEAFAGDKKTGQSILGPVERRFINWAVPKIPRAAVTAAINREAHRRDR